MNEMEREWLVDGDTSHFISSVLKCSNDTQMFCDAGFTESATAHTRSSWRVVVHSRPKDVKT